MQRKVIVEFLLVCVALAAVPASAGPAEDAAKAFQNGKRLLAKVEFDKALHAFRTAAEADAANQEYRQAYAMLRQVIRLREEIETERDPDKWMSMARALRTFYHDHRVYSESLPLDRKTHEQHLAPDSAALLAETLLALGKDSEATEVLGGLGEKEVTTRTNILLGLSLARQGQIDEAKSLAGEVRAKQDADPRLFYELARLRALLGDSEAACEALTRSFELTPPSQLDAFRAKARDCRDLSVFADSSQFAEALKTESKVRESKCSKGPECGKCPKRAKCGSKRGKN